MAHSTFIGFFPAEREQDDAKKYKEIAVQRVGEPQFLGEMKHSVEENSDSDQRKCIGL